MNLNELLKKKLACYQYARGESLWWIANAQLCIKTGHCLLKDVSFFFNGSPFFFLLIHVNKPLRIFQSHLCSFA